MAVIPLKRCNTCEILKPITEFRSFSTRKQRLYHAYQCKNCEHEAQVERRHQQRESKRRARMELEWRQAIGTPPCASCCLESLCSITGFECGTFKNYVEQGAYLPPRATTRPVLRGGA